MKLSWIGSPLGSLLKNRKQKGYILLPEVLMAMFVVSFILSEIWQSSFTVLAFGKKIEKNFKWQLEIEDIFQRIINSSSALKMLIEKQLELKTVAPEESSTDLKIRTEPLHKKSQLYRAVNNRFVYLNIIGPEGLAFKVPVFLGYTLKDKDNKSTPEQAGE